MPPLRQRSQELFKRLGPEFQQANEAQVGREFETKRKQGDTEYTDKLNRQMAAVDTLVKRGMPKQEAEQVVYGKQANPQRKSLLRVANATSDQYPELNVKGKQGTVFIDPETNKAVDFVETAAAQRASGTDDIAKWAKVYMTQNPRLTPEQAAQKAANMLVETKQLLPERRVQDTENAVRTIMGEQGVLTAPTHQPGAMGRGPTAAPFPMMGPGLPNMPPRPPGAPTPSAGAPGGTPSGKAAPAAPQMQWTPEIKGTERGRKDNAEVIMELGGSTIPVIDQVARAHPDWTGATGPTWQEIQKKFGAADPSLGTIEGKMESLRGFLPALHGFRSGKVLDSWKETLDNPLRNPALTQNVIREVMKAAQELRDVILRRSTDPMTAEGEEKKGTAAAGGGGGAGGPSPAALEYMKKHGLQ
jgi:hypothetical protein